MDFNEKFRHFYKELSKEDNDYLSNCDDLNLNLFVSFVSKVNYDKDEDDDDDDQEVLDLDKKSVKLDDFRIFLLLHFLAKLIKKKIDVYVTKNESNMSIEICNLFNFDENYLQIKCLESKNDDLKQIFKESKYAIEKKDTLINLRQIIHDHQLTNFDSNISFCNIDFEDNIINSIRNLKDFIVNQPENENNILLQVCSNSQFVSQQKSFIMTKILLDKKIKETKFLIVSQVKSDVTNINEYFKLKEKYFSETTAQRMSTTPFQMCEDNIKLLTICSITFDLLKVSHNSDIKLQTNNFVNEHDSAFLLYNCARISTILKKFKHLVNQGTYPPLPEIEDIDFEGLLKHDIEKRLCTDFIFIYGKYLNELRDNLNEMKKLQVKLNVHKLCRFLFEFSKTFSSYYSKHKVLEDPKFPHLLPTMFARIYLFTLIYNTFQYLLSLFNIKTPERI